MTSSVTGESPLRGALWKRETFGSHELKNRVRISIFTYSLFLMREKETW